MASRSWGEFPAMASSFDPSGPSSGSRHRPWAGGGYPKALPSQPTPGSSRSGSPNPNSRLASPAGPSSKPPRGARIRVSKACTPCRKVKLKCNGETPCGRCSTLELPMNQCIYPPSLRGKTRRKKIEIEADRRGVEGDEAGQGEQISQKRGRECDSPSRERDSRQWDAGWTMRSMKEDFAKWKHDEELTANGPRNENIWQNDSHLSPSGRQNGLYPTPAIRPFENSSTPSVRQDIENERYMPTPFDSDGHNPLGVLAEASASAGHAATSPSPFQPTGGPGDKPDSRNGTDAAEESRGYYTPLGKVLKKDAPHIMSLISISEAEELFESYFRLLHPHLPFLDREHSTPAALAQRNNFLFNAICCAAARATNPVLWNRLKEFARFEMDRFPKDKNIDVVQGHLIYSVWNITGPKTFEQDKSWLRIGIAIRTGLDINLHRVALSKSARQGLPNWLLRMIVRTWLLTYVIDRMLSTQLGKPATLREERSFQLYSDLIAEEDGKKTIDDAWVSSLAEWTQILGRVHDVLGSDPYDLSTFRSTSYQSPDLVHVFQKQFRQWGDTAMSSAQAFAYVDGGRGSRCMIANVMLYNAYARLIVYSFGLQRALDSRKADLPSAFAEYQISALRLVEEFESGFEATGLTRGCPDYIFTFLVFGAVSLLKGAQPQYAHLEPDRLLLFASARKAASILAGSAATPDHLPAIQHTFLSRLIDSRSKSAASTNGFAMLDFEAFGHSIDADLSKTPWPPTGPSTVAHTHHSKTRPHTPSIETTMTDSAGQDSNVLAGVDMNMLETDYGWGMGTGMSMGLDEPGSNDGFGWLSGMGAGGGFFGNGHGNGNGNENGGDLTFAQDPFWKSILENAPGPQ